jgi:hypothetical protein
MTRQFWFWVIFVIGLLFSLGMRSGFLGGQYVMGGDLLFFLLVGLLGWQVYGPAIKG